MQPNEVFELPPNPLLNSTKESNMKKTAISLVLSSLISGQSFGSYLIDDIPTEARDYTTTPFNLKQKHWLINNFENNNESSVIKVLSPFYSSNTEKFPFSSGDTQGKLPDFFEEDGWELLHHNLGFDKNGKPIETKSYSYPYVVLYNRARGIARIIAYINHAPYTYNSIEFSLSTSPRNPWEHTPVNLFSSFKPTALDRPDEYPKSGHTLSPIYVHDSGQFAYGDIPLSFDPCTSFYDLNMNLDIRMIQDATIKMGGKQFSTSEPLIKRGQYVDKNMLASYLRNEDKLDSNSLGIMTFSNLNKLTNTMNTDRFAKARYKEEGNADLDNVLGWMKTGLNIGASGAGFAGVPLLPTILGKASQGLDYFDFAPKRTLEGFELPDPASYVSVGELALKGEARVLSATRTMHFPITGKNLGLFNLQEKLEASVINLGHWQKSDGSYIRDEYELVGGFFRERKGPRFTFGDWRLHAMLSPDAKKYHMKAFVGLEARLDGTLEAESKAPKTSWDHICHGLTCANGGQKTIISTDPMPIAKWDEFASRNWINLTLPEHTKTDDYDVAFYNTKVYLKVWLIPEHLLKGDELGEIDRETLAASSVMYTYPIKLHQVNYWHYLSDGEGTAKGGFERLPKNIPTGAQPPHALNEHYFYTLNDDRTEYYRGHEIDLNKAYKYGYCKR